MAVRKMAAPKETTPDKGGQAIGAQGQTVAASELAERHHRTSKHRAPREGVRPKKRVRSRSLERAEQKKLPFRKTRAVVTWMSPDNVSTRIVRVVWVLLLILVIAGGALFTYFYFSRSKFFALRELAVEGNVLVTKSEIESMIRNDVNHGVLRADLEQIRNKIRNNNELIKDVEVIRLLPDMLRITITERDPYALARRANGSVVCVDRQGNMFGNESLVKSRPVIPLINGLKEEGSDAFEINRQRMLTYQQLLADLDGSQPQLSSRIDEVYFDDVQGLRVILADSRIAVYLGKEDFRMRLNAALDVLDAVRSRNAEALNVLKIGDAEKLLSGARIKYINATIPKRVVVGLEE